jgi:hypothetical protein
MDHSETGGRERSDSDAKTKEIVPGYSANVMPTNYGTAFTKPELAALVNYVYRSTNTKAKRAALKRSTTP